MNKKLLNREIDRVFWRMSQVSVDSEEYAKLSRRLRELNSMDGSPFVEAKDVIDLAANLGGIALILNHERLSVISTKALGFVKKLRF